MHLFKIVASEISLYNSIFRKGEAMSYGITPTLLRSLKSTSAGVNDILQRGVEENYHVRVMVVGKEGVGKSTLTKRLIQLPVDIRRYNSTDGTDVHIHTCEVDLDSGVWSKYLPLLLLMFYQACYLLFRLKVKSNVHANL